MLYVTLEKLTQSYLSLNISPGKIHEVCSKCKACQFLKRNKKQYGKLPPKETESKPWNVLCVDLTL